MEEEDFYEEISEELNEIFNSTRETCLKKAIGPKDYLSGVVIELIAMCQACGIDKEEMLASLEEFWTEDENLLLKEEKE